MSRRSLLLIWMLMASNALADEKLKGVLNNIFHVNRMTEADFCIPDEAPQRNIRLRRALKSFCQDPYEVTCGKDDGAMDARAKQIAYVSDNLKGVAGALVHQKFPELGPGPVDESEIAKIKNEKKRGQVLATYLSSIRNQVQELMGRKKLLTAFHFNTVQKVMEQTIQDEPNLSPEAKAKFIQAAKSTRLVQADELIAGADGSKDLLDEFYKNCGADGMADNAFAADDKGSKVLVLCPGAIVASAVTRMDKDRPDDEVMIGIMGTMAHEIAHHFDANEFPQEYKKMTACFQKNYVNGVQTKSQSCVDYMGEISADYWGAQVMGKYLKNRSTARKVNVMRESLEDLCGTEDDGPEEGGGHPTGKFRIENIWRTSPNVTEALDCPKPKQPVCTFNGDHP